MHSQHTRHEFRHNLVDRAVIFPTTTPLLDLLHAMTPQDHPIPLPSRLDDRASSLNTQSGVCGRGRRLFEGYAYSTWGALTRGLPWIRLEDRFLRGPPNLFKSPYDASFLLLRLSRSAQPLVWASAAPYIRPLPVLHSHQTAFCNFDSYTFT